MATGGKGVATALPCSWLPNGEVALLHAGNAGAQDHAQGPRAGGIGKREVGQMIEHICRLWCRMFHRNITLPYQGKYDCLRCLRTYEAGYR